MEVMDNGLRHVGNSHIVQESAVVPKDNWAANRPYIRAPERQ